MEIVRLEHPADPPWPAPAVAVGNFDGVHRGHQALIAAVLEESRTAGNAIVLTFDPHPSRVLSPERHPATLMTLDQKAEALALLGVTGLAVLPFTKELAERSPEQFARDILEESLGAQVVVVGSGFRFGRNRGGNVTTLQDLGGELGFRVRSVDPVLHQGEPISSSWVRRALAQGDPETARALLGRPFFVDGSVVEGDRRGRQLGFPTANLALVNEALPQRAVYACWGRLDLAGERIPGVMNIGLRPTFPGAAPSVEVHLLDFQDDIYGRRLRVEFVSRLRGEQSFAGPGELMEQIRRDVAEARGRLEQARRDGV